MNYDVRRDKLDTICRQADDGATAAFGGDSDVFLGER